ncbi:ABC-type glycerol-3-phosphate transport system, substrate-binding protein [Actinoplanes derwentensis]|uniref:ABC-type glycerol-3-phosphate transport system, substrate-binding protein n=1 Tax=Actinoplanes derwentensis TaxID=113562 RepID=A0A1H2C6T9_9ACTN|nr:hypothetical protein Ade03nite_31730 [Actinoplanes derwentensis]SDT66094.1 ABC-type glycerol-3-phosphate transport system, substrate-binding protein [Actinoplanes derwentensis]
MDLGVNSYTRAAGNAANDPPLAEISGYGDVAGYRNDDNVTVYDLDSDGRAEVFVKTADGTTFSDGAVIKSAGVQEIAGPYEIEFTATPIAAGGPNDKVTDLNTFWNAREVRSPEDIFATTRNGAFAEYDYLKTYYVGQGANLNTTTRFRKYVGEPGNRPLLYDYTSPLIVANVPVHVRIQVDGQRIRYWSNVNHMAEVYSRRSFTVGVLSTGLLSSAAGYLYTRSDPVTLTLATGAEPTGGGRSLLINLWNRLNPDITIALKVINSTTQDQYEKFTESPADIYNLDIIHIQRFAEAGRITPIEPQNDISLLAPVRRACRTDDESGRLWAVPFNSDVGMLFRRITDKRVADPEPELRDVLKLNGFIGQLDTVGPQTDEAFVINVLEHALAQDPLILDQEGVLSTSLTQWQGALKPLAEALRSGRIQSRTNEEDTIRAFKQENLRYMRNWPVWYPSVDRDERTEPGTAEIRLSRLPTGILGGQNLAIDTDTPHRVAAEKVINFLTDTSAQKLLATYGFAPTGLDAYIDEDLKLSAPHLAMVRNAVEDARPRPMHPRYAEFAQRFKEHTYAYLRRGDPLTQRFVQDIQEVLK